MCVNCPTVKQVGNALKVSESSACRIKVYQYEMTLKKKFTMIDLITSTELPFYQLVYCEQWNTFLYHYGSKLSQTSTVKKCNKKSQI